MSCADAGARAAAFTLALRLGRDRTRRQRHGGGQRKLRRDVPWHAQRGRIAAALQRRVFLVMLQHRRESADAARRLRDHAPVVVPIEPLDTIIEQVTFIRTFAGQGVISSSNTGPLENWAKYRMNTSANLWEGTTRPWEGTGRLSFFTLWQNQQNNPTIIMPRPNLQIVAHLACGAEMQGTASWYGFSSEGRARVRARTTVWGMDSSVSTVVHDQILYEAVAHGHFFGGSSDIDIGFNQIFPATGAAVPGQAYALIEVELLTEWIARSGSVDFDADSENYRVYLPRIIITQMAPPILLSAVVDYGTTPPTVTLIFSGATGTMVDIYRDGVRLGDTENDGTWSYPHNPGTYTFRVCETQTSVCSADVTVTVTQ